MAQPLSRERIIDCLSPIFAGILEVPAFVPELDMEAIDTWDSLAHVQILAAIEAAFDIEIGFEDAVEMLSGQAILDVVTKYLNDNPATTSGSP